jgi:hypothetical protein
MYDFPSDISRKMVSRSHEMWKEYILEINDYSIHFHMPNATCDYEPISYLHPVPKPPIPAPIRPDFPTVTTVTLENPGTNCHPKWIDFGIGSEI